MEMHSRYQRQEYDRERDRRREEDIQRNLKYERKEKEKKDSGYISPKSYNRRNSSCKRTERKYDFNAMNYKE